MLRSVSKLKGHSLLATEKGPEYYSEDVPPTRDYESRLNEHFERAG